MIPLELILSKIPENWKGSLRSAARAQREALPAAGRRAGRRFVAAGGWSMQVSLFGFVNQVR